MEYQALQQQLKDIEARKAEIERVLQSKRTERKKELIAEFKTRLREEGFEYADICGHEDGRRTRRQGGVTRYPLFAVKSDPNLTYIRGPVPGWMKEKMAAIGLDPADKGDRERYKSEYMERRD